MAVDPMPDTRFAGQAATLAASADRDRAIDVLKAGFAEGRLTKAEYDDRVARVYTSRTYGELGPLIADLPAGPLGGLAPYPGAVYLARPPVNSMAVAALTCGVAVFLTMGLTGVPAIVLGHRARRQVRRTGQRGDGMALAGVALGWGGVALLTVLFVALAMVSATGHAVHPVVVPAPANPGGPLIGG
jgi:Domain of unknown function (DUF1707)/Domain of unknown function (DUF4190)